ncbi:MAG: protein kinase [Pyrinomonadaceae bacterium]
MPATTELLQEGRYRINQESAIDGNTIVFEAYDTVRDANVVVKEIPLRLSKITTVSQQELMKLAFANQAKTLTEIHHDSLLHVHDFFSEDGRQYLVLESVDGDDLGVLLARNNSSFPVSDVLNWADQMLDALNYLHNFKPPVIHRNIRPEHIKLNSSGKIKLLAFGLAEGSDSKVNTSLTDDAADESDISYLPLEQFWDVLDSASQKVITNSYDENSEKVLKQPADARSDIYALGATLYHLLTAVKPMDALERSIDMMDGKDDPLRKAGDVDAAIPAEISDVLMKAMAIRREERYDSASIMRQVLRTALVRMKERESEEAVEMKVTAEEVKQTQKASAVPSPAQVQANAKKIEDEAAATQKAELVKQVREAEEQSLAADAERRVQEEEAAVKAALTADAIKDEPSDDDLLQILLPTSPAAEDSPVHQANPEAKKAGEAVKAKTGESVSKKANETAKQGSTVSEAPVSISEETNFDVPVSRGFPLGMPLIAVGIGVVLIVIVAAWVLMPGNPAGGGQPAQTQSEAAAQPAPAPAVQSMMPSNTEVAPAAADPKTSEPAADNAVTPDKAAQKAKKPTPTPKPAKPAAEAKKAVTVDDLINDN